MPVCRNRVLCGVYTCVKRCTCTCKHKLACSHTSEGQRAAYMHACGHTYKVPFTACMYACIACALLHLPCVPTCADRSPLGAHTVTSQNNSSSLTSARMPGALMPSSLATRMAGRRAAVSHAACSSLSSNGFRPATPCCIDADLPTGQSSSRLSGRNMPGRVETRRRGGGAVTASRCCHASLSHTLTGYCPPTQARPCTLPRPPLQARSAMMFCFFAVARRRGRLIVQRRAGLKGIRQADETASGSKRGLGCSGTLPNNHSSHKVHGIEPKNLRFKLPSSDGPECRAECKAVHVVAAAVATVLGKCTAESLANALFVRQSTCFSYYGFLDSMQLCKREGTG
eukprot:278335-Chlamydomonas_euryale.AAC.3